MQTGKRMLQTSFLLLLCISAFAQPPKKDWQFSLEGNYYQSKSSESDEVSQFESEEKSWHLALNAERFLTNHFSVGLGIARYHESEQNYAEQLVSDATGYGIWAASVEAEATFWMPHIFCKYYLPVWGRLYLVPRFSGSYGNVTIEATAVEASVYHQGSDQLGEIDPGNHSSTSLETSGNLLSLNLVPELVYFFSRDWGVLASFGGLGYDRFNGDLHESEWTFSFKRQYWKLGVNYRF